MLVNLSTQQYPVSEYLVLSQYPEKSFPQDLSQVAWAELGYGFVYLTKKPVPENQITQGVRELPPQQDEHGVFHQTWEIYDLDPITAEIASVKDKQEKSERIRSQRTRLLQLSDWTQVADVPLLPEQKQQWATYRQALRDITSQPDFPYQVAWPTQPQ